MTGGRGFFSVIAKIFCRMPTERRRKCSLFCFDRVSARSTLVCVPKNSSKKYFQFHEPGRSRLSTRFLFVLFASIVRFTGEVHLDATKRSLFVLDQVCSQFHSGVSRRGGARNPTSLPKKGNTLRTRLRARHVFFDKQVCRFAGLFFYLFCLKLIITTITTIKKLLFFPLLTLALWHFF